MSDPYEETVEEEPEYGDESGYHSGEGYNLYQIVDEAAYEGALKAPPSEETSSAATSSTSDSVVRNRSSIWNTKFQSILQGVRKLDTDRNVQYIQRSQIWNQLAELSVDFTYTAEVYGRIIISEVFLPAEKRTIKPMVGRGVLGGQKFMISGIMFKFALDSSKLFGGDDALAAKVAGSDLIGLNSYFSCEEVGLYFPLMSLVDYRGFRLIALSLLPIGSGTLVSGSDNAGSTILNRDDEAARLLASAAKKLNIAVHKVVETSTRTVVEIPTAFDVECHRSPVDSKLYMLDFSRTMPPQSDRVAVTEGFPTFTGAYLVRLLRPEFVSQYPTPLCSDAYSRVLRFPKDSSVDANLQEEMLRHKLAFEQDVDKATTRLLHQTVPRFARWLFDHFGQAGKLTAAEYQLILVGDWLTIFSHFHGINLRYLGAVSAHLPEDSPASLRTWLAIEAIARTLKNTLRSRLRHEMIRLQCTGEEPYKKCAVEFLNLVFGLNEKSLRYWNFELRSKVMAQYPRIFTDAIQDLRVHIFGASLDFGQGQTVPVACLLFKRVAALSGIQFTPATLFEFSTNASLFDVEEPFDAFDIITLKERTKTLQIIAHSQGVVLRMKAGAVAGKRGTNLANSYNQRSLEHFQLSLRSLSRDSRTLRNTADVLESLGAINLAQLLYELALDVNKEDTVSLYKFGSFMQRIRKDLPAAERFFKASAESPSATAGSITKYADFCFEQQRMDTSRTLYERAVAQYPDHSLVWHKLAMFAQAANDTATAETAFLRAFAIDDGDEMLLQHMAVFFKDVRKDEERYQTYWRLYLKKKNTSNSYANSSSQFWK